MNTKNTNANVKIELPVEFQVDVSLTESNISGKIFNGDLEIPIYIKYGDKEILIPEARCFISMQMLNESIHAEMYGLQIEAYVKDKNEKDLLFDAIQNVPCINHKAQWVSKWLNGSQNLLTRLIGFGLVEGLFFAGSFCAIYYFRKRGLLPGLALSNDWIARDEGMHFSFSSLMFRTLREKYLTKTLDNTHVKDISLITGQKPITTKAKSSIAQFKIREGMAIGVATTLRGHRMYEFLDRLINLSLPRVRDFRGLTNKSFDGNGNYTLGIKEQVIFPEIDYNSIDKIRSLQITIVTTAKNNESGIKLLTSFGFPFINPDQNKN